MKSTSIVATYCPKCEYVSDVYLRGLKQGEMVDIECDSCGNEYGVRIYLKPVVHYYTMTAIEIPERIAPSPAAPDSAEDVTP